jgi:hypothetical protein
MAETAMQEHRIEAGERLAKTMPEHLATRFQQHLQRKRALETEHGRKLLVLELEDSL